MTTINSAVFISSHDDYKKCPDNNLAEFAFIGRSNVGKSSLINMLTGIKKLAKISSTPGKTQTINHYLLNNSWYLVDLPGYGYAKISMEARKKWERMTLNYMSNRKHLECVFILIDSRIEPQKSDLEFINKLGEKEIPLCLVFTKTDKLTKNELDKNLTTYKKKLLEWWEELPPLFITSSDTGRGRDELLDYISSIVKEGES